MSGRLTILPKKTYCPWKPENVERVLRDERLERERIEKEKKNNNRRASSSSSTVQKNNAHSTDNGHINLFPEAKETELRLAKGGGTTAIRNETSNKNAIDTSGVLPIPLGGDESTNRKLGNVPFYMNTSTTATNNDEEKYNNTNGSFRLGNNRIAKSLGLGQYAAAVPSTTDEITNKIMKDQYIKREDHRKFRDDPMKRFYVNEQYGGGSAGITNTSSKDIYKVDVSMSRDTTRHSGSFVDNNADNMSIQKRSKKEKKHKKKHHKRKRKKKKSRKSYTSDSSSSSRSTPSDDERYSRKRRKKQSRSHHYVDRKDLAMSTSDNTEDDVMEELRTKRRAREAKETERERQLVQHRY